MDRGTEDKKSIEWRLGLWTDKEALGEKDLTTDWKQPVKLAMWVQNGRIRFYVNGDRVFDFNQVELGDIASLQIDFWSHDTTMAIRRARFAESTPDFGQTIMASGKFVTHGILFDTDSDRVKPESAAVLQMIARVLTTTPDLNVEIDGHTDATGNAAHNMDLSKRRAEAVKNILVSQFRGLWRNQAHRHQRHRGRQGKQSPRGVCAQVSVVDGLIGPLSAVAQNVNQGL
jgi:outer membrane protein OmpA-like peptidoglycan-associated protein